jgi:5-methylcytosine-specific restriction enzyme subunit McrC
MLPFIVDMPTLYERFVAKWLDEHLSDPYSCTPQENVAIGDTERDYEVDLVFYLDEEAIAVADTKYKAPSQPATGDISQVIAYAEAKGVEYAFLVYPEQLPNPVNTQVGTVDVGTLTFGLDDSLDTAVQEFLRAFISRLPQPIDNAVNA